MHFCIIIHSNAEPAGAILDWLKNNNHTYADVRPFKGDTLPSVANIDGLFIMGGPQSPMKTDQFPYLIDEMNFINAAIKEKKYVIGFCLGAQLISNALGAKTCSSPEKEVGVFPITLTNEGLTDPIFQDFPKTFDVEHWHFDMPGLPDGAKILATSPGCPRQIIRFASHVYGFQCHFEFKRDNIKRLINAAPQDLEPSTYTQDKDDFLKANFDEINQMLYTILDRLCQDKKLSSNSNSITLP